MGRTPYADCLEYAVWSMLSRPSETVFFLYVKRDPIIIWQSVVAFAPTRCPARVGGPRRDLRV